MAQEFTERLTELRSGALVWTMGHKWLRRGRGSPAPLVPGATTSWTVPPGCLKLALVASVVMFAVLLDVLVMILLGVPVALFIVWYRHSANVPVDDRHSASVPVDVPVQRRVKQRPSGPVPTGPVVRHQPQFPD
eukprot:COSAG02_NODE_3129_length_7312_cov_338.294191_7_plen_134_part_00